MLLRAIENTFAPPNQPELYRIQLRTRRPKASESVVDLGQDMRILTWLAYPLALGDVRATLVKVQFIDAFMNTIYDWRLNSRGIMILMMR